MNEADALDMMRDAVWAIIVGAGPAVVAAMAIGLIIALMQALTQVQEATPQLRTARAMMPMEYDDTESFRSSHLGVGEKLEMPLPSDPRTPPFATYTWDTGTHFVTVTAVCSDRERFGTVIGSVDDLARTVRVVDDLAVGEAPGVLRIEPKN